MHGKDGMVGLHGKEGWSYGDGCKIRQETRRGTALGHRQEFLQPLPDQACPPLLLSTTDQQTIFQSVLNMTNLFSDDHDSTLLET